MTVRARKGLLAFVLAVACVTLGHDFRSGFVMPVASFFSDPIDLLAFRCAGQVASSGADPYRSEPLRSCESAALAELRGTMVPHLVVPAPLPPYALAAFAPLGRLSFRTAIVVWFALLFAAFATTCVLLVRMTRLSLLVVLASLAASDFFASAVIGQVVPLVVLAAVASAALLRAERPRLAALAALGAMIEPHLGLPLCLALAVNVSRTRSVLACGAAVLAFVTFAAGGFAENLEYVTRVLPAQEHAEGLVFAAQYGLSALLYVVGVPAAVALAAGSFSYLMMLVLGVWLAGRIAHSMHDPAFVAFVPIAFVLIGGPYLHIHQMAAAIPLALAVFAIAARPAHRIMLGVALVCLAIPWEAFVEYGPVMFALFPHTAHVHIDVRHVLDSVVGPNRLAEDAWGAWAKKRPYDPRTPFEDLLVKLPTWVGLVLLSGAALALAFRRRGLPVHRAERVPIA